MRRAVALVAGLTLAAGCGDGARRQAAPAAVTAGAPGSGDVLERQYEQVVKTVLPSVVQINTESGLGSGVVYDTKGDIVTNDHVVAGARRAPGDHAQLQVAAARDAHRGVRRRRPGRRPGEERRS